MSTGLFLLQLLNGLQLGALLFLLAAGLTLVFGIMNFLNLTHGSLFMIGAYFAAATFSQTGSYWLSALVAVAGTGLVGLCLEKLVLNRLYSRDHLDQVLCTFGMILIVNELVQIIWGTAPRLIDVPESLSGTIMLGNFAYPTYRLFVTAVGLFVALGLYFLIHRTRLGMLIRAGSLNPTMVSALGTNIAWLNGLIFTLGASLAGLAGAMAGPTLSVQSGMGEPILILTLVVIVTGGIGSIRGAFFGALIVGVADTLGRAFLPMILRLLMDRTLAQAIGPALASMLIYLLMAVILAVRPQGLFPVRHG